MAIDTNYQTANYEEQGGAGLHIGGSLAIESGGYLNGEDGSIQLIKNGATLGFQNTAIIGVGTTAESYYGIQLKALMRSLNNYIWTNGSTASTVLSDAGGSSPPIIPSNYGTIVISATDTMTNGSLRLATGISGQTLRIIGRGNSVWSVKIFCSGTAGSGLSGVKIIGSQGAELSCIHILASAGSHGWVVLQCLDTGNWAIIDQSPTSFLEVLGA